MRSKDKGTKDLHLKQSRSAGIRIKRFHKRNNRINIEGQHFKKSLTESNVLNTIRKDQFVTGEKITDEIDIRQTIGQRD